MSKFITVALIAAAAHAVNRDYCLSLGDASQPSWEEAPQWQKDSAIVGVEMHLANPDATPEQSHAAWLEHKLAEGWAYGEVKDAENKLHPCCVPYEQLPLEQKAKDYIFRAVVHAVQAIAEQEPEVTPAPVVSEQPQARSTRAVVVVGGAGDLVQYIGRRPEYTDRLYGSGLTFTTDQVRRVPGDLARKLLRHGDLFAKGEQGAAVVESVATVDPVDDTADVLAKAQEEQAALLDQQNKLQDLRDQVLQMDTPALELFAQNNYRMPVNKRLGLPKQRDQVIGYIDQYGAV